MNKRNYQKELEKILNDESNRGKKLLLHSCCAPCSSYVLTYLASFFEIIVFYYNPNITDDEEYGHRVLEQRRLIDALNEEFGYNISVIDGDHDVQRFYEAASGLENEPEGGKRCAKCFRLRLSETLKAAIETGADYFGTTLTISPLKNADLLNAMGELVLKELMADSENENTGCEPDADSENVSCKVEGELRFPKWLPSDFKKKDGYKQSIELSKKYDLYRQDFCGCEFSKAESLDRKT